jgi:4-amino-4-deoxy-L-arabinose transferase-like glycosyltransferase
MFAQKWLVPGVILTAILLLAAFFRFWQLGTLPPGLYHDEAYNGLDALSLLQGKTFPQFYEGWELYAADAHAQRAAEETRFPLFFEGNYGREPLHVYLMALSVALLGATPFALRAVPAAAGVLAVLTTFFAANALFGEISDRRANIRVALLAAFFLAILYPAVHFSRFALRAMVFVPVETMAVACFWWAINRHRRLDSQSDFIVWFLFVAAGFFLGLGIYVFAAARLFPLVWLLFIPLWFWFDREALADFWRQVLAMAGASLLTALPLLYFFARYPYYFVFRIAYVANKGKGAVEGRPVLTWLLNTGRVARGFLWQGETHLRHNLPGRPLFDPIQLILFLLGLVRSIWQIKQPRYLFLLIWFGIMLLPSILSGDAPHFGRLSGSYAPAAILAALGAEWLWRSIRDVLSRLYPPRTASLLASAGLLLLLVGSATLTYRDYFIRYAEHPDLAADFYLADWQVGQYAALEVDQEARLFLSPTQEELATIYFALGDPGRLRNYDGGMDLLPAGTPGLETLYLLRSGEVDTAEVLLGYFPEAIREPEENGFDAYRVPAETPRLKLQTETNTMFAEAVRLIGWSSELRDGQLFVTLAWQAEREMENSYTAYLHLTGRDGTLAAQVDQPPAGYPTSDWVPGEIIIARYTIPWPEDLAVEEAGLKTGFYFLPTLKPLGEAAILAEPGDLMP